MNLRFGVGLCAVVVGLSGLTLCQPPRPRIASVTALPVQAIESVEANSLPVQAGVSGLSKYVIQTARSLPL